MSVSPWNECFSKRYLQQSAGLLYRTFQICFTFSPQQSESCALSKITSGSTCHPALFCFCFLISNTHQVHLRKTAALNSKWKKKVREKFREESTSPPLSSHMSLLVPFAQNWIQTWRLILSVKRWHILHSAGLQSMMIANTLTQWQMDQC